MGYNYSAEGKTVKKTPLAKVAVVVLRNIDMVQRAQIVKDISGGALHSCLAEQDVSCEGSHTSGPAGPASPSGPTSP